jgi:hypothetical protein
MHNCKDWFFQLLGSATLEVQAKIIYLLWRSWHHRNNVVHGDGKASISSSVQFLVNYQQSYAAVTNGNNATLDVCSSWTPPGDGKIKANVDAGWDSVSKHAGLGIIIRDQLGQVILTEWKFIPFCNSAEEAEVLACLEGIRHLINLQRWPAILESDCLRAVMSISSESVEQSPSWALILEARELLKIFRDIVVSKVDRVCNGVAHVLAQVGKSGVSAILCDSVPDCVRDLVFLDCKNTL